MNSSTSFYSLSPTHKATWLLLILPWVVIILFKFLLVTFPEMSSTIFAINLWLLSWPHTLATFQRFDLRGRKEMWVFGLLSLVSLYVLIFSLLKWGDLVILMNVYFYWQFYHYGTQNLGMIKSLGPTPGPVANFFIILLQLAPVFLILSWWMQGGMNFFGYFIFSPKFLNSFLNLPEMLKLIFILIIVLFLVVQTYSRFSLHFSLLGLSHFSIFGLGLFQPNELMETWALINIYHNVQYLIFIWDFDLKAKHKTGHQWISIVQTFACSILFLGVTIVLFKNDQTSKSWVWAITLGPIFLHYVFDGIIWKRNFLKITAK